MTHASPETAATEAPADLSAFVESERRRADVVGVSYAAFNRDGVAYAGAFGHADLDRGERVTTDTRFRAASISKLFTTTLVFQEIEAGRIGLDDSVNRHLDEPARLRRKGGGDADDVTIRHLLTHTSGLPVSWRGIEYDRRLYTAIANESLRTFSDLSTLVAGQRTVRPPGRRLVYSNGAFNLLGYLVQRLNGEPFADLVHGRVLAPLGMHSSGFPAEAGGPGVATPYGGVMTGAGRKPAPKVRNHSGPAGALITTANDLARFGIMVLRGGEIDGRSLLPAELLEEALQLHFRNHPDLDDGWGLGFAARDYRGRTLVSHSGGLAGVSTLILLSPQDGTGVLVLTNGGDYFFVSRVAYRLLEAQLGLESELVPGSPAGVPADQASDWADFTDRVTGRYEFANMTPPGVVKRIAGFTVRPKLAHVVDNILALEGMSSEPAFLYPDGQIGRYRAATPLANGARVVIEERGGRSHIWVSILHLRQRR